MERNLRWLDKELKKDANEIVSDKKKFIKEILKTDKKEITKGSTKIKKESIWKRLLKKVTGL
jgi:hypothetical protein